MMIKKVTPRSSTRCVCAVPENDGGLVTRLLQPYSEAEGLPALLIASAIALGNPRRNVAFPGHLCCYMRGASHG
jgi:hypothetical protein